MNKSLIFSLLLGIPSAIVAILSLLRDPENKPIFKMLSSEVTLPIVSVIGLIIAAFTVGTFISNFKRKSKTVGYTKIISYEPEILRHLIETYGDGFTIDDARVYEAFQKKRHTIKDIAIFTNMTESKVQGIVNGLADKHVDGFESSN